MLGFVGRYARAMPTSAAPRPWSASSFGSRWEYEHHECDEPTAPPLRATMVTHSTPSRLPRRTPRPWYGMTARDWFRLLARNRFAVSPSRLPMAMGISVFSVLNSIAAAGQRLRYGRFERTAGLEAPPLFVVGHWRTGTTLLHELLALDDELHAPTTYQCMAPRHFLITQRLVSRLGFLLPANRPVDEMRVGWSRPQEDEFALFNLGQPSPIEGWAFPRSRVAWDRNLDPADLTHEQRRHWEATYCRFLRSVALNDRRRLVLKSPGHTARVGTLARLFPGAFFVHIVRDPYVVHPSTVTAWRRLGYSFGLQTGHRDDLEEVIIRTHVEMYGHFERDRVLIDPAHIVDVRYEDLIADPVGTMRAVYRHLGLGGFNRIEPAIVEYFQEVAGYRTNEYRQSAPMRRCVTKHWREYARRYGYHLDPQPSADR